jgi:NADPH2:quinone reductase
MKAIRVHQPGGPEVLQYEDVPDPSPGPGQVLIELVAAGINFSDTGSRRRGDGASLPYIPGSEGAGTIAAIGEGVTEFRAGDLVAFQGAAGCYAEKVAATVETLAKVPEGIAAKDAAAAMLQGRTAYAMVFQAYKTKPGDRVLIHAAAGGVGLLLTQMAKHAGAHVFATVGSDAKVVAVKEAGADQVINYSTDDFAAVINEATNGEGVNAIFDSVGQATFVKGLECLASRGYLISYGQASGPIEPFDLSLLSRSGGYVTRTNARRYGPTLEGWRFQVSEVFAWIRSGRLRLRWTSYPLARAADAHRDLESRATIGKLLLIP